MKFSIVITTYQRKDGSTPFFLKRTLQSILSQTYSEFKVYVIGDKYENNEEFELILSEFPKEKIYYENLPIAHERDKYTDKWLIWKYAGCYANNYGINKSISDGFDYVCHLDHDDVWYPNHLDVLRDAILKTKSPWLCTKSEYVRGLVYPQIDSDEYFIPYLPQPEGLIHSSTCINFREIPLRHRNVFEETGVSGLPGDADLWFRISNFLREKKQNGILINKITCKHLDEGYERN